MLLKDTAWLYGDPAAGLGALAAIITFRTKDPAIVTLNSKFLSDSTQNPRPFQTRAKFSAISAQRERLTPDAVELSFECHKSCKVAGTNGHLTKRVLLPYLGTMLLLLRLLVPSMKNSMGKSPLQTNWWTYSLKAAQYKPSSP